LFLPLKAMTERFLMVLLLSRKVLGPTITLPTTDSFGFDLISFTTCTRFEQIMNTVHWRKYETNIKSSLVDKDWIQLENGIGKGEGVRGAAIPPSTHTSPPVQVEFVTSDAILVSVYTVQALQFKDLPADVSLNIVSRIFYFMYF
jgi:hypothetical protein